MIAKDPFPFNEKLSEAGWNAQMTALETNWQSSLSDARDEYQDERMRLERGKSDSPEVENL
ncbi:hypothetical protein [Oceanispirochaeta sp.]|jgi:hypothetical protein|uniref:hypothetical protein n=1 Tax=Oceanispirochaeta sp. TaxID=2035350 RepID=UPI00260DF54C|nr:hypothetical protein [Oceanispirochaeta sp.]MDA3958174.1 hypothetical protein [Oceanispirochaeta sp.]